MKFYEFPIYYHYMVIYSTTNDKPVIGEIVKWDFVKCWQKGILCIEGRPKNSSYCVGVEYSSQANPANPHFFGSAPLPRWFLGGSGVLFNFAIVYYYVMMMVKEIYTEIYYIAQRRLFEINWKKFLRSGSVETRTGRGRAFAPSSHN